MLHCTQSFSPVSFALFLLLIPDLILAISSTPYHPKDHFFISCGASRDSSTWLSDDNPAYSSSASDMLAASTSAAGEYGAQPPYDTARIFNAPLTYSFSVSSPGPKLVRLYFSPNTTYNTIHPSEFYLSVKANTFNLLTNFSAYLAAANAKANPNYNTPLSDADQTIVKEFYITVDQQHLNLTFSPVANNSPSFGFVNGIEIVSTPKGLYVRDPNNNSDLSLGVPYLLGDPGDYGSNFFDFSNSLAMEMIVRLNVGGVGVSPTADSGLYRTWYDDTNFFLKNDTNGLQTFIPYNTSMEIEYTNSTPPYTAPEIVYSTMRMLGPYSDVNLKLRTNLTWVFEVDDGFNYLVRLHFCELLKDINTTSGRIFNIYINNQTAAERVDVFYLAGGSHIPIYKDFITFIDVISGHEKKRVSRVLLWVALRPVLGSFDNADAFLNGLEIFKLSDSNGSLAAPNPPLLASDHQINVIPIKKRSHHWLLPIIIVGGVFGLVVLISLLVFIFCLYHHRRWTKTVNLRDASTMSKQSITDLSFNTTWVPIRMVESSYNNSSVASSLSFNLFRRFSLSQIRSATSDFDESLVIGTGGFGEVYKGSFDGGSTTVAIKRLNRSSNQGSHEFHTEIKLLSGLSYLHLVSLIGYCEEHGEMVLVYEYMPRGSLRDHLYKSNSSKGTSSGTTPLSWKQRLMICVGSARGLNYLHAGAKELVIHRDIKSTNILLDDKWTAKVSDFGLSRLGPAIEAGVGHVSTAVKGSIGYLDPEYFKRKKLTVKSDVYSFGVLLFEVLCARPVIDPYLPRDQVNLALWARRCYKGEGLYTIMDPILTGQIAPESLTKFGEIAEMCVSDLSSQRPTMSDVVWALEFALELQETADKTSINIESLGGSLTPTSASNNGRDSSCTEDYMFSPLEENLSNSSGMEEMRLTKSNNSHNSYYDYVGTTSNSVFSEIMDQEAR